MVRSQIPEAYDGLEEEPPELGDFCNYFQKLYKRIFKHILFQIYARKHDLKLLPSMLVCS